MNIMINMNQEEYNFWTIVLQVITTLAAVFFAFWQASINKRLKDLQDFVGISLVVNGSQLQIRNIGKMNLYLRKWEVGTTTEDFLRPVLIPTSSEVFLTIAFPQQEGTHEIRLYLLDEQKEKYLSVGVLFVEKIGIVPLTQVQLPLNEQNSQFAPSTISINNVSFRSRALSYQTRKYKWTL